MRLGSGMEASLVDAWQPLVSHVRGPVQRLGRQRRGPGTRRPGRDHDPVMKPTETPRRSVQRG